MEQPTAPAIYDRLTALSDPTRVRLLRLLEREEATVGELVRTLSLPQSTVSRHLKMLHARGWLSRRNEGPASWFRMNTGALRAEALSLWRLVRDEVAGDYAEDLSRLGTVIALREADGDGFFARVGGDWDALRRQLFGDGFVLPTLLSLLPPELAVADLGCGTGSILVELAPHVRRVIGVDREPAMLATARARTAALPNVELHLGELDHLPLASAEVDAALCMLVLHHADPLPPVFAEIARILRPGGRCVVLDMGEHDRVEYRETMGHRHLGFARATLEEHARDARLRPRHHRVFPPHAGALGPPLFVAVLEKA